MNMSMSHPIEELDEKAQLMRVSWRKAFNYHNNLAKTLLETKEQIATGRYGSEWTIERWLSLKAGLNYDQLVKMILVYSKLMESGDRRQLEAEKEQVAKERRAKAEQKRLDAETRRAAARERRDGEAMARAREKLDRETAKADAKAAKAAAKVTKTAQAKQARADAAKKKRATAKQKAEPQAMPGGLAPADRSALLDDMAAEFRAGYAEAMRAEEAWIDGTIRMASALAKAREQFPSNPAFGKWLKANNLVCQKNDRQALIQMGRHIETTRFVLAKTKSRSYETIWRKELKPQLVEDGSLSEKSEDNFSNEKTEAKIETAGVAE